MFNSMKKRVKSLDDLEIGIEQLLLENRYSFSEKEIDLLKDCLLALQKKNFNDHSTTVVKVLELLTKLFVAGDKLKDLF